MTAFTHKNILVLALSARQARIFTQAKRFSALELSFEMHPESDVKKNIDINTDRDGRSFDRFGKGRHAMMPKTSSVEHTHINFAKAVIDKVIQLYRDDDGSSLLVIATPDFVGYIRERLTHTKQINKVSYIVSNTGSMTVGDLQELIITHREMGK